MIQARYNRALDSEFIPFLHDKRFGYLLHDLPTLKGESYALDVQIREHNKIMYYHGTTCLLVITLAASGLDKLKFKASAHNFYTQHSTCAGLFEELVKLGKDSPVDAAGLFRDYLAAALMIAPNSHYGNHAEGFWQNRLCHRFGRKFQRDDEWLVVDRECVIGFKSRGEKDAFYRPILAEFDGVCERIRAAGDDKWRSSNLNKSYGDELDMLAVDRNGNLLAVELKYGSNSNGITWGSVQVGLYGKAFSTQLEFLSPMVLRLIKQKIELGLLPPYARDRLPDDGFHNVTPVLAVAKAKLKSNCWSRMAEVMDVAGPAEIVTIDSVNRTPVAISGMRSHHIVVNDA
ncbi:hypothetical protein ACFL6U_27780 [Planctomycetota bacterium]